MPTRTFRKQRRPARTFRKRKPMNLRRIIKQVIVRQSEKKYNNISGQELNIIAGSPSIHAMNDIAVGDSFNQRIGDKLEPTLLHIKFKLQAIAQGDAFSVRCYIIQNTILDNPAQLPDTVLKLMPTLRDSEVPYKVLYDRVFDLSLGVNGDLNRDIKIRPNLMMATNTYTGPTHTTGLIRMFFISDNTMTNACQMDFDARFRYTDN